MGARNGAKNVALCEILKSIKNKPKIGHAQQNKNYYSINLEEILEKAVAETSTVIPKKILRSFSYLWK